MTERDYQGAVTLIKFYYGDEIGQIDDFVLKEDCAELLTAIQWLIFCYSKVEAYEEAKTLCKQILQLLQRAGHNDEQSLKLQQEMLVYQAICSTCLGDDHAVDEQELKLIAKQDKRLGLLINRFLFHVANQADNEQALVDAHRYLGTEQKDKLCLAAVHFQRHHFQEATDLYKQLLLDHRSAVAINVYIAMCYYKLDYYEVSLEILAAYLQVYPDSVVALNLKACNHFKLYNARSAETELKAILQAVSPNQAGRVTLQTLEMLTNVLPRKHLQLMKHNVAVFSEGKDAIQVFPTLITVFPEAKLNLAIHYLKTHQDGEAFQLLEDFEPTTPQEYILKGIVHARLGQSRAAQTGAPKRGIPRQEHLRLAQQFFQLVGASASECDTIPGRQCMASCFFLLKQFDDVNIYLSSIKAYLYNDDTFNYNYGVSLAKIGKYRDAEEHLLLVTKEAFRQEYVYQSWLARCYVFNRRPQLAWELYLRYQEASDNRTLEMTPLPATGSDSNLSFQLLQLIANDCYRVGEFYYAAKAFDRLEQLDQDLEYWEGKRGSIAGVFQLVIAEQLSNTVLSEMITLLKHTSNPQVEYLVRILEKYGNSPRS